MMDWFQMGKGVWQECLLSPYLFKCMQNAYKMQYIMQNARLYVAQAGIKIAGRNINNLRYANDTTLTAESEEELKSLLVKVKEESEKAGLILSTQKTKIMASGPITSWKIEVEWNQWKQWQILYSWPPNIMADGDYSHEIKRCLFLEEKLWQT